MRRPDSGARKTCPSGGRGIMSNATNKYGTETLQDGRKRCRVKITGTYKGEPWEYTDPPSHPGSQFIWPDGDNSSYWWSEGNMGCDCNRARFAGVEKEDCGGDICIDSIVPLDPDLPALHLNESAEDDT